VLEARLCLEGCDPEQSKCKISELNSKRRNKQPLEYPSAGSTFKRPEGGYAGALIEQAGLKGLSIGAAQVSEKHAGFIINAGGATPEDVIRLITEVQKRVKQQTGIHLEPEVKVVGEA
jgi:UDP-N-acetylmuramate dehydrogenase